MNERERERGLDGDLARSVRVIVAGGTEPSRARRSPPVIDLTDEPAQQQQRQQQQPVQPILLIADADAQPKRAAQPRAKQHAKAALRPVRGELEVRAEQERLREQRERRAQQEIERAERAEARRARIAARQPDQDQAALNRAAKRRREEAPTRSLS